MVDVEYVTDFKKPVNLKQIKEYENLQDFALVKQSRLSVMPVSDQIWALLCKLGEINV